MTVTALLKDSKRTADATMLAFARSAGCGFLGMAACFVYPKVYPGAFFGFRGKQKSSRNRHNCAMPPIRRPL